jgi:hypothetical protein
MEPLPACELYLFRPTVCDRRLPFRAFLMSGTCQIMVLRIGAAGGEG